MTNNNPESQQEKYADMVGEAGAQMYKVRNPESQQEKWEEEFHKHMEDEYMTEEYAEHIKSFIHSLLTQKEQEERERVLRDSHSLEALGYTVGKKEGFNDGLREERERVLEMIEGMRKEIPSEDREDEATRNEVLNEYNQALQDLRDRITKRDALEANQ